MTDDSDQVGQVAGDGGLVVWVGARRRQRQVERRPLRLTPRFSEEELAAVSEAAALAGLTPTGYEAKVAVDVATARVKPVPTAVVDAIGELLAARYQVQKFSALVNQAVAKWHSTEEVLAQLLAAVGLVGRVLPRLEEVAAVRVSQLDAGRRRVLAPRKAKTEPAPAAAGAPDGGAGGRGGCGAGRRRTGGFGVIGRVYRGGGVGGLLRYLYGPGRHNEHENPHLVAAWDLESAEAVDVGTAGAGWGRGARDAGVRPDDGQHGARDGAAAGVGEQQDGVALPVAGRAGRPVVD